MTSVDEGLAAGTGTPAAIAGRSQKVRELLSHPERSDSAPAPRPTVAVLMGVEAASLEAVSMVVAWVKEEA